MSTDPNHGAIRHGFSGAMYTRDGDNRVKVVMPNGLTGFFDGIGQWIEGELYDVDPQMCVWVSANRIMVSHRISKQD
ncbi:MAG: hypothetical protein P8J01_07950 [Acidimicrobiales bacterium]|jgi:hypothetical protein|nr:hypothetical protein [Acidimicrobiales bacterium]MDG1846315.1 hypothetical protein [Acidimicrobiales bacterium]